MLQLTCPAWGTEEPQASTACRQGSGGLGIFIFHSEKPVLTHLPGFQIPTGTRASALFNWNLWSFASPTIQTGALALAAFGYWRGMSLECVTQARLTAPSQADLTPLRNYQIRLSEEGGEK